MASEKRGCPGLKRTNFFLILNALPPDRPRNIIGDHTGSPFGLFLEAILALPKNNCAAQFNGGL